MYRHNGGYSHQGNPNRHERNNNSHFNNRGTSTPVSVRDSNSNNNSRHYNQPYNSQSNVYSNTPHNPADNSQIRELYRQPNGISHQYPDELNSQYALSSVSSVPPLSLPQSSIRSNNSNNIFTTNNRSEIYNSFVNNVPHRIPPPATSHSTISAAATRSTGSNGTPATATAAAATLTTPTTSTFSASRDPQVHDYQGSAGAQSSLSPSQIHSIPDINVIPENSVSSTRPNPTESYFNENDYYMNPNYSTGAVSHTSSSIANNSSANLLNTSSELQIQNVSSNGDIDDMRPILRKPFTGSIEGFDGNNNNSSNNNKNTITGGTGTSYNGRNDAYNEVDDFVRVNNIFGDNSISNNHHHIPQQRYQHPQALPNSYENLGNIDVEAGYIPHNGDDYQINSYLDRNGNIIDPYRYNGTPNGSGLSFTRGNFSHGNINNIFDYDFSDTEDDAVYDRSNGLNSLHGDLGEYKLKKENLNITEKRVRGSSISVDSSESSENAGSSSRQRSEMEGEKEPDGEGNNGSNRERRPQRRAGTEIRRFRLYKGNFVFDSPISKQLLNRYRAAVDNEDILSNEFKFMRYQAVTCEPNEMAGCNFTVRQLRYLTPRSTELMIVITMYNEDHILLGRTLKGVMDNIRHMVLKKNHAIWGPDAWKKVVVCIVSDGRLKINEKALALISSLGCYQDGFAKDEINGKKVGMHVYEHTTMMNITDVTENGIELKCNQSTVPIQLLFALKEKNQKKINSHRWAFEGFGELLQPHIVVLLDAGTMPGERSIYNLWKEFDNPHVGGACGEIRTDLGKNFKKLANPLVASQNFEYKMSNILDKTTKSNFGFITVLPGAFSAYRMEAVRGEPLRKYFYGEQVESEGLHFFSSNMYLAEDRILCFEIVVKRDYNWILKYCRSSHASTDVPERVPEFILQRRRWLNGSFFAGIYSFFHFFEVWQSGHNIGRKLLLTVEFIYLFVNTLVSWFSLSSFFLVFRILTLSIALDYSKVFGILSVIFLWLYGISIFSTFILSLGNKPKSTEKYYVLNFIFFAILMCYIIFCSIFLAVKSFENVLSSEKFTFTGLFTNQTFRDMIISMCSTYVLYFVSSIVYLQPWHMITSFIQYLLLSPSYINVLNIYAFCNVHDISWGTKGAVAKPLGKINTKEDGTFKMEILVSGEEIQANYNKYLSILNTASPTDDAPAEVTLEEKKPGYYANVRSLVIIFWVLTNFIIVAVVLETGGIGDLIAMMHAPKNNGSMGDMTSAVEKPLITKKARIYFNVVLWLVALSALFRFSGCTIYMISRMFRRMTKRQER